MIEISIPNLPSHRSCLRGAVDTPFGWLVEITQDGARGFPADQRTLIYWLDNRGELVRVFPDKEIICFTGPADCVAVSVVANTSLPSWPAAGRKAIFYLQKDGTFLLIDGKENRWKKPTPPVCGCKIINPKHDADLKTFAWSGEGTIIDNVLGWMFNLEHPSLLVANPRTEQYKILSFNGSFIHKAFVGAETILVGTDAADREAKLVLLDNPLV